MSSSSFEKVEQRSAGEKLLNLLKMRGPLTSGELGQALGVTGEAVRQQMTKLSEDGLIMAEQERRGVGRPRQVWRLTDAGESRFPDRHALVTIQLIDEIRARFGQHALDKIIEDRGAKVSRGYVEALSTAPTLRDKVAGLADLRTREGYMAEWGEEADGSFTLAENHCPICAAASRCQGFCVNELESFAEALGGSGVSVERKEHILSGSRRCVYRISVASEAPQ